MIMYREMDGMIYRFFSRFFSISEKVKVCSVSLAFPGGGMMKRNKFSFVVMCCVLSLLLMFAVLGCEQQNPHIIDEGIFDRVEYKMGAFNSFDVTIIYWADGRTLIIQKQLSIGMKQGHCYQVTNNRWGRIKMVEVAKR